MPRKLTLEQFIENANKIHNYKFDYSKTIYINGPSKGIIICKIHGEFSQSLESHLQGKGCKKCHQDLLAIKFSSNTLKFISNAIKIHGDKYNYDKVNYINSHKKIIITCKIHGDFLQKPNNHLTGSDCFKCMIKKVSSKQEIEWLDFLNIKNKHYTLSNWSKKIVDGFDEETNTIYEFLGDFWHGNPVKFEQQEINVVTKESFGQLYKKTFENFKKLKSLGYKVKYIWENDWKEFKKGNVLTPNIIEYI